MPRSPLSISRRNALFSLSALPLLALTGACQTEAPLTIASHVWPGYEFMFLARSEGWLPADQIRLYETPSATRSIAALREGHAHAAALTLDEVLRVRADGMALTVVLVFDVSAGADVVIARPDIQQLSDLRGAVIGAETTALGALMLDRLLSQAGLGRNDVKIISVTPDDHLNAWRKHQLDALVTYEPTAGRLLAEGAHRLLDSRQFPETIFDVLAIKTEAARTYADALRALIAGHFRGIRHLRQNPQDAAYRLAARLEQPGDKALESFHGLQLPGLAQNRRLLAADGRLQAVGRELSGLMRESGLLTRADSLNDLISDAYLPDEIAT